MTNKISWCFDAIGTLGALFFLMGIYTAWGLATLLMAAGLILIGYALRLSYLFRESDDDDPDESV